MILILARNYPEAERIAALGGVERFGWKHLERPEQLVGWERPRVVVQDGLFADRDLIADLDARSAVFFTEFDLQQGRVR